MRSDAGDRGETKFYVGLFTAQNESLYNTQNINRITEAEYATAQNERLYNAQYK